MGRSLLSPSPVTRPSPALTTPFVSFLKASVVTLISGYLLYVVLFFPWILVDRVVAMKGLVELGCLWPFITGLVFIGRARFIEIGGRTTSRELNIKRKGSRRGRWTETSAAYRTSTGGHGHVLYNGTRNLQTLQQVNRKRLQDVSVTILSRWVKVGSPLRLQGASEPLKIIVFILCPPIWGILLVRRR